MSISSINTKACRNCKHLLGIRHDPANWEKWYCVHPNNVKNETRHVITDVPVREYNIVNIYPCRVEYCRGEWFEEYNYASRLNEPENEAPAGKVNLKKITMDQL